MEKITQLEFRGRRQRS